MRLYFARHGESQANITRVVSNHGLKHPLTPNGRIQALTLAHKLEGRGISHVYASPVLRALETSIIIANHLGIKYEVVDALREYDCGDLEGRSDEACWQQMDELARAWVVDHDWERRHPGGESGREVHQRFDGFVNELVLKHTPADEKVLCVSHGGVYWLALPLILTNLKVSFLVKNGLGYTTCCTTEMRREGLTAVEWNFVAIPGAADAQE
jgi:broad specificity phosphatase PhoE